MRRGRFVLTRHIFFSQCWLSDHGEYQEAEPLIRRVAAAWEKLYGASDAKTLQSKGNLALAMVLAHPTEPELLEQAEELFRQTLTGQESALGQEHVDTLETLNNLAWLLLQRCDPVH